MATFHFEILTPSRKVYSAEVSEVVLTAYDGEVGILPDHADFVGMLGMGPLKVVKDGKDFWFLINDGLYQVLDGRLTVFTEAAESAAEVNIEASQGLASELEQTLKRPATLQPEEITRLQGLLAKESVRVEIHRRTNVVN